MCGIFASLFFCDNDDERRHTYYNDTFHTGISKLKRRGPDDIKSSFINEYLFMGFTRLSINDLTSNGMQPMCISIPNKPNKHIWLVCNGEIFNHEKLIRDYELSTNSKSDCEVILHLYAKMIHGNDSDDSDNSDNNVDDDDDVYKRLINLLDGEFAFVLFDEERESVLVARDNFGVRPIFWGLNTSKNIISFASELKALSYFCDEVQQFPSGSYYTYTISNFKTLQTIPTKLDTKSYCNILSTNTYINHEDYNELETLTQINILFRDAVKKRLMSERPLCCLLSGGLDSSLVASLVASHFPPYTIHTFSIGLVGSPDLKYAKQVAEFIQSNHHSIELDEHEFLSALEDTIETIESYDTTSVRASVGNLLVSKYIKKHTDFKVVFNGDYSDEVCGGYKYLWNAPSTNVFDEECRSLVKNICYFDSLRSDRTISGQGLEARVPFADKTFVKYYLSIPPQYRIPNGSDRPEKYLLRKAFEHDNLLPYDVLWRPKEAFSDGVSKQDNSWHSIINNHINTIVTDDDFQKSILNISYNIPSLKETFYYRRIFEKIYGKQFTNIIPYYWLPKWCGDLKDPSAREIMK